MSFGIAQRVICIRSPEPKNDAERVMMTFARKGAIYTIRGLRSFGDATGLHFHEICNPEVFCFDTQEVHEPYFAAWYFRPLIDRSTDTGMAILRRILDDHKTPIREHPARVTAHADHSDAPPS